MIRPFPDGIVRYRRPNLIKTLFSLHKKPFSTLGMKVAMAEA
jgi:hypothetical protein